MLGVQNKLISVIINEFLVQYDYHYKKLSIYWQNVNSRLRENGLGKNISSFLPNLQ